MEDYENQRIRKKAKIINIAVLTILFIVVLIILINK